MESSVISISSKLPVNVNTLDQFACRQLDKVCASSLYLFLVYLFTYLTHPVRSIRALLSQSLPSDRRRPYPCSRGGKQGGTMEGHERGE
jgi:hypothetical protein